MFKYGVSAALHELPATQPVTLRGDIEAVCAEAAGLGYDAVELHIREPGRYDPVKIRRAAENCGLAVCAAANGMEYTVGGLSLIDDDGAKREAAVRRLAEHADFAAGLGAMLIVGIIRGNIPKGAGPGIYRDRFGAAMRRVCGHAAGIGVKVVLESILRYINNYLNSVPETMDYIENAGIENLSLHIDTHSMAMEESDLVKSVLYCSGKPLGYVHYSENNRRYPGAGAIDFKALTKSLIKIGYSGYITLECLPWPTGPDSAGRGLIYMKAVERAARMELAAENF